jgi:hypothetical protein
MTTNVLIFVFGEVDSDLWHVCAFFWLTGSSKVSELKKKIIMSLWINKLFPMPTEFRMGGCQNSFFQQYFSYIVAVSFIGGGNWSAERKPPTCRTSH